MILQYMLSFKDLITQLAFSSKKQFYPDSIELNPLSNFGIQTLSLRVLHFFGCHIFNSQALKVQLQS
uniref:Uncharacterized protein n=1 Tax=Arundo donax TaxID=35708 RepID=A0A0A9H771_ARUDO